MTTTSLISRAASVLRGNDTGIFTKPGPHQYPHQWNWDSALIALGLSHFDLPRAQQEIRALLSGQWRDGMLPHVVYHSVPSDYFPTAPFWQIENSPDGPGEPTSGITQPPLVTTVLRRMHERHPMPDFAREVYPALLRWHRWGFRLFEERVTLSVIGSNLFDEEVQQHIFGDIIGRKVTGQVQFRF